MVSVETGLDEDVWALGEFVVRTGLLHPAALARARARAQKAEIPIERLLVERCGLPEDVIRRFCDLDQQDRLFDVLRQPHGQAELLDERPHTAAYAPPLPAPYVIKEARRQLSSWDGIRRKVGRAESVFKRDLEVLGEVLGYEEAEPGEEPLPELSANARIVYFFMNGKRTLGQIAWTSGLPLFDALLATEELMDAELCSMSAARGVGEVVRGQGRVLPILVALMTYVLLGFSTFLGAQWLMSHQSELQSLVSVSSSDVTTSIRRANAWHLDRALRLYELQHRAFPENLEALRDDGFLWGPAASAIDDYVYETRLGGFELRLRPPPGSNHD